MLGPKCVCLREVQLFYCQVPLRGDYKKDVEDVKETAIKMLSREYSNAEKEFRLVNGYRRVDPRRGAEYILDIGIKPSAGNEQGIIRYFSYWILLQLKNVVVVYLGLVMHKSSQQSNRAHVCNLLPENYHEIQKNVSKSQKIKLLLIKKL